MRKIKTSPKLLAALSRAPGEVAFCDPEWAARSVAEGRALDPAAFPVQDPEGERKYGCAPLSGCF